MRVLRLSLLLILLPLLSGCFGAGGVPLPLDRLLAIRDEFETLDRATREEVDGQLSALQEEVARLASSKDRALRQEAARKRLLIGYCWERRGDFIDAERSYAQAASGEYGSIALFRTVQVAEYRAAQASADARDLNLDSLRRQEAGEIAKAQEKQAIGALTRASNFPVGTRVLLRYPPAASAKLQSWQTADIRYESYKRLDGYYRDKGSYKVFAQLVRICGGGEETVAGKAKRSYPYLLAIVLIAVLAKVITTPLSAAQFRSMRAIQAIQPELKKLQEKYKDDKQQMARAQMELFKEHKVNPASSCLPMLIQFPILIWVYYAIRHYVFQFEGVRFLYIKSLANPDVVSIADMLWPGPLLLLYGVSMYFSQKLLAQPATTPEQQQQQKLLTYMMPVVLLFILKSLPAAFILYWLLQNILMTGHQYLIIRQQRAATAVAGAPGKAPLAPPPPEAIQKLSQGTSRPRKKRKRR